MENIMATELAAGAVAQIQELSAHAQEGRHAEMAEDTQPMRIMETRVYRGPNPYGYRPIVRFVIDLGTLEQFPTNRLPGFTQKLLKLVPSLHEHGCSYGEPGGFVRRLEEGTWLGHVAEHVAMELQCLAGTPVTYGKTRELKEQPGSYNVVYSYLEERVGLLAGWMALRLIDTLLPPELCGIAGLEMFVPADARLVETPDAPFDFQTELEALIRIAERQALGPTTQSLVDEARKRGIPALRLDEQSLVQLGYGRYQQRIRASVTGMTSHIALETASDKNLTCHLLSEAGIPVPQQTMARTSEEAVEAAEKIGYPVVTKPVDGNHGRGVSLNLMDAQQVIWGFEQAQQHSRAVIVERYYEGYDFRVLVVNYKVVACAQRVPARVVGDGEHTIAQLIEIVNQDPRRGVGHEKVMTRITVDAQVERLLEQSGHTLETVLPQGEMCYLRATANMSTGGTAIDMTDVMHPDNIEICERAAHIIGLDVAGIDIVAPDITRSLCEAGGGIVEVNAGPGFRMHLQPSEGKPRNVARPVIDMLFPDPVPCRIPVISITGTNGKTTTSRMVAHIVKATGKRVGLTTSTGIYIDEHLLMSGDTTGPKSARMTLQDPTIDVAVLETARGGILREGLGFDRCDVGAVLNIQPDHLGLKGVETIEDLAWVKSLIVEVVKEDGHSVLNADDPLTTRMRRRAEGKLIFFSMHGGEDSPEHLRQHIQGGGKAVVLQPGLKGDMLTIYDGEQYIPLLWAHEIPATIEGMARFNVQNALAAAAITYGLGVPADTIRKALGSFATTFEHNPGRLNIYDKLPFRVILDYAHNPDGMREFIGLIKRMRSRYNRVLSVLTGTGDRRDQDTRDLGAIVAEISDEMVIKETTLLRGRPKGIVPQLIEEGAIAGGLSKDNITHISDECAAVQGALERARPNDLVLVFCDNYYGCWERITSFQYPTPQSGEAKEQEQV